MCDKAIRWVLDNASDLPIRSSGEYVVLVNIANRCNPKSRVAWPSLTDLATATKLSPQTVREHIRALTDSGILSVEFGGGNRANLYSIVGWSASGPVPVPLPEPPTQPSPEAPTPMVHHTPMPDDTPMAQQTPMLEQTPMAQHSPPYGVAYPTPMAQHRGPLWPTIAVTRKVTSKSNIKENTIPPLSPQSPAVAQAREPVPKPTSLRMMVGDDSVDKGSPVWQAMYDGACLVLERKGLSEAQSRLVSGFFDEIIAMPACRDPAAAVEAVRIATEACAANGKTSLNYWKTVITSRLSGGGYQNGHQANGNGSNGTNGTNGSNGSGAVSGSNNGRIILGSTPRQLAPNRREALEKYIAEHGHKGD